MTANMASLAISIPIHLNLSASSSSRTSKLKTHLPYPLPHRKTSSVCFSASITQLGSSWNGLRSARITVSKQFVRKGVADRRRCRGNVVYASLFGVGAPEALVIGVVALLVFGPKGLAEVARNLGKTLRAFQPTIRELQDVSREFKSTLEREIGLDDIANPIQNTYTPPTTGTPTSAASPASSSDPLQTPAEFNGSPAPSQAYTSEEYLKITEEQLKAAAAASALQEEQILSTTQDQIVSQKPKPESTFQESTSNTPPPAKLESDTS